MKNLYLFFVTVSVVAFASCQQFGNMEEKASFTVDSDLVVVESDADLESDPFQTEDAVLTDTIMVSSSRSWSVSVKTEDGGNWVRSSAKEFLNVSSVTETVPLVLTFDKYKGAQDRTATVTFYAADISDPVIVSVTQKAYVPYLELYSEKTPAIVESLGGECYVFVRSNTSWEVSIDESQSTVTPSLSMLSGEGTKAILLSFPANVNEQSAAVATLSVKGEGCQEQTLQVVQSQSERFFMLTGGSDLRMKPYESELQVPLLSNGEWSARILDSTFENAVLVPAAGTQCLTGFRFSADHGADPELEEKTAVIAVSREGFGDIVLTISQKGSIHLSFCEFNPDYEFDGRYNDTSNPYRPYVAKTYPFVSPESVPQFSYIGTLSDQEVECVMAEGGYVFTMYGRGCGVWLDASTVGWGVGKKKDDFVMFPAIEGYRLSEMYYEASCRASNPYSIRTADGLKIIKGGEASFTTRVVPVNTNHHDMRVHIFPDTEPGVRYRLNLEEDNRMISIKDLCLVYEKVN